MNDIFRSIKGIILHFMYVHDQMIQIEFDCDET